MRKIKYGENRDSVPPRSIQAFCDKKADYTPWHYCDTAVVGKSIHLIYKCEHCATGRSLSELEIEVI